MSEEQTTGVEIKVRFFVAIVDPGMRWGPTAQTFLRTRLAAVQKRALDDPEPVSCYLFEEVGALLSMLKEHPWTVPIVEIADTAAKTPTPEEGLFSQMKTLVPRCVNCFYTASDDAREGQRLLRCAPYEPIDRRSDNALEQLGTWVGDQVNRFLASIDYRTIRWVAQHMNPGKTFTMSLAANAGEEGAGECLTPKIALENMIRGTARGVRLGQRVVPDSVFQFPS